MGCKKRFGLLLPKDIKRLLAVMQDIANGNHNKVDAGQFKNSSYGDCINAVIDSFKKENNPYVMRMNDTVEAVGDNKLIKQTLDQVNLLTEFIANMKVSSSDMENSTQNISGSIGDIRDNTHKIMSEFQTITPNMENSIKTVDESSRQVQQLNVQMQEFQANIAKISEIVDVVKKISTQSNLLALNASVEASRAGEAGKGFGVVASEMRQLSVNTTESAEDIAKYIEQLDASTKELVKAMNETALKLENGNVKAKTSLDDMMKMDAHLTGINEQVDNIYNDIDTQTESVVSFLRQIDNLSESYAALSADCINLGQHIFKIGRYVDKTRSDMVRNSSDITLLDWIRVFQVDHFILLWRVYNNIVGFEHLLARQVNEPNSCKLGVWISQQTNQRITESREFRHLKNTHELLHKFATLSWEANEKGDKALAMEYFKKTYNAFLEFDNAISQINSLLATLGQNEYTEIKHF